MRITIEKFEHFFLKTAFLLNCIILFFVRVPYLFVERLWPDESLYAWFALQIHHNFLFSVTSGQFLYPPLVPSLMSLGNFVLPAEISYRFVILCLNLFGVIGLYRLGQKISSLFLGTFSSLLLGYNFIYFSHGNKILLDQPCAVFTIWFMLALAGISENSRLRRHISVGLWGSCVILTKISGILIFPILILYYLAGLEHINRLKRLKKLLIPAGLMLASLAYYVTRNYLLAGVLIPSLTALKGAYHPGPFYYYLSQYPVYLPAVFLPGFLFGLWAACKKEKRIKILLLSWFYSVFFIISAVTEKEPRYMLPLIPCLLLISGLGLEFMMNILFKKKEKLKVAIKLFLILSVGRIAYIDYQLYKPRLVHDMLNYTGYTEAAYWIKEHAQPDTIIFTGSLRSIRYSLDKISKEEGEDSFLSFPRNIHDFENFIENSIQPVILEIDLWEYTQPGYIFPYSLKTRAYLKSLGFKLEKVVNREILTSQGLLRAQVIWLFTRTRMEQFENSTATSKNKE